ncbi:MAG: ABC transporter permease [SAR202 cluster bacterium]|nr:ABC transporter permease [SAR202 cluster bacterium]
MGRDTVGKTLPFVVFVAALIGVWQAVAMAEVWPSYTLPSPEVVWNTLARNVENGRIQQALAVSMQRLAIGYVIALAIGMVIGVLCGVVRIADRTVGTLVLGMQSLPSVAWLPLAVLWFGLNDAAIIFVVVMGSLFSIAVSARSGIQSLPAIYTRVGQTYGATRLQMYRHVVLPGMAPSMAQGLKLGWSFGWRSLMAGELLFAGLGLGQMMTMGRDLNDMGMVIAVMLVIVAVGLVVDRLAFGRLEWWVQDRWGVGGGRQ